MKKLIAESLNEWRLFSKRADVSQWFDEDTENPYENEYSIGEQLVELFHELGFDDATLGSVGHNHIGIECEHANQVFLIKKNGDVFYEGVELTGEQRPEKIGNLNDLQSLKIQLEKILV